MGTWLFCANQINDQIGRYRSFFLIEIPVSLINVFWYIEYFKSLGNHDKKVFWGWRKGWNKLIGGTKECHWFILMLSQTGHNKYFLLLVPQLFVEQNRTRGDGGIEAALAPKQWHTDKKNLGASSGLHFVPLFVLTSFLVENQCFHDKPIRKSRNWICRDCILLSRGSDWSRGAVVASTHFLCSPWRIWGSS